ncbi:hypothetical protein L2E82_40680 [Cichorium intybus]|uniref:Uncharacterized protein n=1 Tax=Cichorium intybus TaxID=13427 RepID=A0ACB9ALT3_CICIN|nr:hypothetical protein L2E82_40680 [Cichorium intybus]
MRMSGSHTQNQTLAYNTRNHSIPWEENGEDDRLLVRSFNFKIDSFTPVTIASLNSSNNRNHRKKAAVSASASVNWWTLLFGWLSDPDYIELAVGGAKSSSPLVAGLASTCLYNEDGDGGTKPDN